MSSMRNAVQRRNHKERAQPLERQKWGLLEKRKDYSKRAADHNLKKRKIKALQGKASERNEDEFYFAMVSGSTKNGIRQTTRGQENGGGTRLSHDVVALMKTQDAGYLRTMVQQTRLERERLEREAVIGETGVDVSGSSTRKVVFGDDGEPVEVGGKLRDQNNSRDEDDDLAGLDGWSTDDDEEVEREEDVSKLSPEAARKKHQMEVRRRKVDALKEREQQLTLAWREVEVQRAKMTGKTGGVNKNGIRFKARHRKR